MCKQWGIMNIIKGLILVQTLVLAVEAQPPLSLEVHHQPIIIHTCTNTLLVVSNCMLEALLAAKVAASS